MSDAGADLEEDIALAHDRAALADIGVRELKLALRASRGAIGMRRYPVERGGELASYMELTLGLSRAANVLGGPMTRLARIAIAEAMLAACRLLVVPGTCGANRDRPGLTPHG